MNFNFLIIEFLPSHSILLLTLPSNWTSRWYDFSRSTRGSTIFGFAWRTIFWKYKEQYNNKNNSEQTLVVKMHESAKRGPESGQNLQQDWKNTERTAAEEILRSQPLWSTPTSRTIKSTGRQLNSSHPSTHGIPDASERPSRSSSTTLFHRTSVSSSVIFGDPYYGSKDLLYPKSTTQPRLRDLLHPKSTALPHCLLTADSVQWAHTPLPHSKDSSPTSFPPAHFNALILQHPVFAWSSGSLLKQQHLPESGILLMTIRAYQSKCWVVTSSSFQN